MKKVLSIILLAAMLATLASCGGDAETAEETKAKKPNQTTEQTQLVTEDSTGDVTEDATGAVTDAATEAVTDAVTNAVTNAVPEEATEATTEAPAELPGDSGFIAGEHGNEAYTSDFTKLGFTLPSGWEYATQEELNALVGITDDMTELEIKEHIEKMNLIYDAVIFSEDHTTNVMFMYEKSNALAISMLDPDKVLDTIATSLKEQYASMGLTQSSYEKKSITIGGNGYPGIDFVAGEAGINMYQRMFITTAGDYIASICITTLDEAMLDTAMNNMFIVK